MSANTEPVRIIVSIEVQKPSTETVEIPREEWNRLTPAERETLMKDIGETAIADAGGYGVYVENE